MQVERVFEGTETLRELLLPIVLMEIDRLLEEVRSLDYNESNANTSHSEGAA